LSRKRASTSAVSIRIAATRSMNQRARAPREMVAVVTAAGSIILGLLVVVAAKHYVDSLEASVLITLIMLPLLAYVIASGRLAELKAPGGLEAKFTQAASESVSPASETVAYDNPQVIAKESVRSLIERKAREIDESQPIVMTMALGGNATYNTHDVG